MSGKFSRRRTGDKKKMCLAQKEGTTRDIKIVAEKSPVSNVAGGNIFHVAIIESVGPGGQSKIGGGIVYGDVYQIENVNLVLGERPRVEEAKMNGENQKLLEQAKEILRSGDEEIIRAFGKTVEGLHDLFLINERRSKIGGTKGGRPDEDKGKPGRGGKGLRSR